ncbi:MAG: adenosylmethionine decarboxylase [Sterolibacterium sp.]|nr:adenosylmethionine decarboxylase [Sterolibacterium sp.]MBP9799439.1 adenosylmethionine decarboxylase [Sterolibacterium sp.]
MTSLPTNPASPGTPPHEPEPAPTPQNPSQSAPPRLPGLHLMGDLYGCQCAPEQLLDADFLSSHCQKLVEQAGLHALQTLFHRFEPEGGVTGMVVLAESHLSLHTWPEENYVTLDVYVCNHSADNRDKAQQLFAELMATFQPADPHLWRIDRA